ncbi:PREDICTED: LIM domain-containing protein PLIM2b-like [Ipomoea nil]|uniref:LIM domain-containing protein PLIM2b-like n=1 Tax=Ipomoea nil TaxID=35883 RepID=UPI0009016D9E|nr:PREDICTED: LIM domain-containing protein PLIM2b-like [Ipomoea nil]
MAICPQLNEIYWFDSIGGQPRDDIKDIVEKVIQKLQMKEPFRRRIQVIVQNLNREDEGALPATSVSAPGDELNLNHREESTSATRGSKNGEGKSCRSGDTSSKVSSLFAGTQDKCVACKKTVYPIEKVAVDGTSYHRACFKCSHGGCVISPSNYVAHEHKLYCRHHHTQFKEKGNFSQLDTSEKSKEVPVTENGTA